MSDAVERIMHSWRPTLSTEKASIVSLCADITEQKNSGGDRGTSNSRILEELATKHKQQCPVHEKKTR